MVAAGLTHEEDSFYRAFIEHAFCNIAVDGGIGLFFRESIVPDYLIGDLDSLKQSEYEWAKENSVKIQTFPREKDATDTQLALKFALDMSPDIIYIFGAIGSRLDHTLANIYLLKYSINESSKVIIINPWHEIQLLRPGKDIIISGEKGELISVIPISQCIEDLSIKGCKWELENAVIYQGNSIGVSNYLKENSASFSVGSGECLVIKVKERVDL